MAPEGSSSVPTDDPEQTAPQKGVGGHRSGEPIEPASFLRMLFSRRKHDMSSLDVLSEIPLFEMLNRKELKLLAAMVHERNYAAGELICEQGTPGAAMYIVKKGAVELFRQDAQGRQVRRLGVLEDVTFFGEGALIDGSVRIMSARAIEPTEALVFFRADLDQIVDRMPTTGTKILRKLAWVVTREMESAMEDLYRERE
jgi:CRP/FNR family cyclic AMP-dependent transcriptional regulator